MDFRIPCPGAKSRTRVSLTAGRSDGSLFPAASPSVAPVIFWPSLWRQPNLSGLVAGLAFNVSRVRLVIAQCTVDYLGRLTAHLPSARRLLLFKADGSVDTSTGFIPPKVKFTPNSGAAAVDRARSARTRSSISGARSPSSTTKRPSKNSSATPTADVAARAPGVHSGRRAGRRRGWGAARRRHRRT